MPKMFMIFFRDGPLDAICYHRRTSVGSGLNGRGVSSKVG